MKIRIMLCATAFLAAAAQSPTNAAGSAGVRDIAVPSRERGLTLDATAWYPAQPGGEEVVLGDSTFFVGTTAMRDAPIAEGKFPLILLSHGAGLAGNPEALSWIATPLAEQGFVVVAPRHPGNSGKDRSAAETMKMWLRPADISETLSTVEKDAFFEEHLAPGRIGMLGLSMGGGTALAIAGARLDPQRLANYCDTDALNPSLCGWIRLSGVDLHTMDLQDAARDNRDKRIRFAMAIDPAPIDVFDTGSFTGISIPVDLVNLGRPGQIPVTTDASAVAKLIPAVRYAAIEDASHYSMFAECKPGAAEIAEIEKIGDPICADGGGRSRNELHAQLVEMTIKAFSAALKASQ